MVDNYIVTYYQSQQQKFVALRSKKLCMHLLQFIYKIRKTQFFNLCFEIVQTKVFSFRDINFSSSCEYIYFAMLERFEHKTRLVNKLVFDDKTIDFAFRKVKTKFFN